MNLKNKFNLEGKVAFISGGSRGLGKACALALAEFGASIALGATDEEKLIKVSGEIKELGSNVITCPMDIANPDSVKKAIDIAAKDFGKLDILVNAAGIWPRVPCLEMSEEEMEKTFQINTFGTFYICNAAANHMKQKIVSDNGGGRIVNFGSVAGFRARPNVPIYAASKAAVHVLTQSIAVDWAKYGIRANVVIPGQFDTDMGAPLMNDPNALEEYVKRIPASRVGQPEELPSLVIYLCSDASSYVTGGLFPMDGGLTLQ